MKDGEKGKIQTKYLNKLKQTQAKADKEFEEYCNVIKRLTKKF